MMASGALFSPCRNYRYALWRQWDVNKPWVGFIGLNPSTANENTNDPTLKKVIKFASDWDYGGVYMLNLFAWVTPHPHELYSLSDPVGDNHQHLFRFANRCQEIIFAWGASPKAQVQAGTLIARFPRAKVLCLNKGGSPRHPLYVAADTRPVRYRELKFAEE